MASGATAGAAQQSSGGASSAATGQNPFQICTNLYAEKNLQGLQTNIALTASAQQFGGQVNAGQFLRGVHLMVRNSNTPVLILTVNGRDAVSGAQTVDGAFDVIQNMDLINVDGSEILYNMPCYSHYLMQKYAKPWLKDWAQSYDYQPIASGNGGAFTAFLQPEIRWTAGVLANTDTRSQYRFDYTLSPATATTTLPNYNITPYMDAWAQPDANDLQGTPNQPVPPGVNLQVKRRHQIFTINSGADNTILSTLTGNAIRCAALVARNTAAASVRVDGFSDPLYWYLDNRSLGRLNPDIIRRWAEDQYATYDLAGGNSAAQASFYTVANNAVDGLAANQANYGTGATGGAPSFDFGVAVFPRFILPGELMGQGWLYTANSTKLAWETVAQNSATSYELIVDEVYPVGNVDPTLVDI
jgi:hypothetical protein